MRSQLIALTLLLSAQSLPAQTPSFTGLGHLPGGVYYSSAHAISGDGRVVVGTSNHAEGPLSYEAFRWTWERGVERLGDLPGRTMDSSALAVSVDGSVIAGSGYSAVGEEAFRLDAGGMQGLGTLPG